MKKILILLAAVALLLTGCKESNWMDWKTQNEIWLKNNQSNPLMYKDIPVITTESGLQYQIITTGNTTDAKPHGSSTVYLDYKGWLINGYKFDSNNYTMLNLSQTVAGFTEGVKKLFPGGDIVVYIPWDLAYGEDGSGAEGTTGFIPPYSTLIFEIHLCAVAN